MFDVEKMGIEYLMDKIHVGESDLFVAKQFFQRCRKSGMSYSKTQRKAIVRHALKCHHANQQFYREVMRG